MKQSKLEKIIGTAAIIGLIVSFIMLVGTAGAIECDTVTAAEPIKEEAPAEDPAAALFGGK